MRAALIIGCFSAARGLIVGGGYRPTAMRVSTAPAMALDDAVICASARLELLSATCANYRLELTVRPARAMHAQDLFASLRARVEGTEDKSGMPPPKGPDEVGADCMGPSDVVDYLMRAMAVGGEEGFKVLLSFALSCRDAGKAEDFVGQLQPGYFNDPNDLTSYLASEPRYTTLTNLEEWKPMGIPDTSDMSRKAVQKLLVRRPGKNWEDLFINMQIVEVAKPVADEASADSAPTMRRWVVTSIYKQKGAD